MFNPSIYYGSPYFSYFPYLKQSLLSLPQSRPFGYSAQPLIPNINPLREIAEINKIRQLKKDDDVKIVTENVAKAKETSGKVITTGKRKTPDSLMDKLTNPGRWSQDEHQRFIEGIL